MSEAAEKLCQRYLDVRGRTLQLCEPLSPEDCAVQSMPDASPAKWHLGHTSWFFETVILENLAGYRVFHPQYRVLFNSYYNTVGDQYPRPQRGLLARPDLAEIVGYRAHVDEQVCAALASSPADPTKAVRREALVELGLHHEQQHQELLLTDVKHMLSHSPIRPVYRPGGEPGRVSAPPALRWMRFDAGVRNVGANGEGFAFDNERPRHRVFVEPFELASRPVTCREYLEFVGDGGYERPELWLSDGWAAVESFGWRAPLYWEEHDSGWITTTLTGQGPVRAEEPVCHVSHYEADAYARWAGARLPSEAEWETAALGSSTEGNFVDSGILHPEPAEDVPGLGQLFGDVWEWTQSAYVPYPGFLPLDGSLAEYNGKFMSGQLVLRGGSCLTPHSHIRPTYRNFFPPDARWQMSGLRLARS